MILFFVDIILQAQRESIELMTFLMVKSKMMNRLKDDINSRQEKVLLRMFKEGIDGFKGGLSTKNYMSITGTSSSTATRDLSDLVEKKSLTKTGTLKFTRYHLNMNF